MASLISVIGARGSAGLGHQLDEDAFFIAIGTVALFVFILGAWLVGVAARAVLRRSVLRR
jgi:hypothetical protein